MVDNKVKTKTAMLQELESIRGLLREDDDIPILQEVISDHDRAELHHSPLKPQELKPQELDELHSQFEALSKTISATPGITTDDSSSSVSADTATTNNDPTNLLEAFSDELRRDVVQMRSLYPSEQEYSLFNEPAWNDDLTLTLTTLAPANQTDAPSSPTAPAPVQQTLAMDIEEYPHKEPAAIQEADEPEAISDAIVTEDIATEELVTEEIATEEMAIEEALHDEISTAKTLAENAETSPATSATQSAASPTQRPALVRAAGENPFLPEHIRARLHGNNPPPLFDFSIDNGKTTTATKMMGKTAEVRMGETGKNAARQQLIKEIVGAVMPHLEEELRQRLQDMTEQELEQLRDHP